jgi:hypothetical protein
MVIIELTIHKGFRQLVTQVKGIHPNGTHNFLKISCLEDKIIPIRFSPYKIVVLR